MLCQNCNLNEASIHLYTNVNGNQQQVDLCQNCYKIMKSDPENPLNQFNQTGGSNFFDDFFSDLNNFRSSNGDLPNTPPTQEGGNQGNGGNTQGPGLQEDHANKLLNSHKVFLKSSALTSLTSLVVETLILLLVVTRKSFVSSKFLTAVPRTIPSSSVNPVSVRLLSLKV